MNMSSLLLNSKTCIRTHDLDRHGSITLLLYRFDISSVPLIIAPFHQYVITNVIILDLSIGRIILVPA